MANAEYDPIVIGSGAGGYGVAALLARDFGKDFSALSLWDPESCDHVVAHP